MGMSLGAETLSVLIVDDEPEIRELLRSFLECMKCWNFIVEADSGRQALMKTQNQRFDLIITDLSMPKINGIDFIRIFKQEEKRRGASTPILILSAFITSDSVKSATEYGVKHVLAKPCSSEEFITKVGFIMRTEKQKKAAAKAASEKLLKKRSS